LFNFGFSNTFAQVRKRGAELVRLQRECCTVKISYNIHVFFMINEWILVTFLEHQRDPALTPRRWLLELRHLTLLPQPRYRGLDDHGEVLSGSNIENTAPRSMTSDIFSGGGGRLWYDALKKRWPGVHIEVPDAKDALDVSAPREKDASFRRHNRVESTGVHGNHRVQRRFEPEERDWMEAPVTLRDMSPFSFFAGGFFLGCLFLLPKA
jgi:hypothetical protein